MSKLLDAIFRNDIHGLKDLLEGGATPDEQDSGLRTPLMHAVTRGRTEVVQALIASGADASLADKDGFTALHFAAQDFRPEEARFLLDARAAVDARDVYGNTPLWLAVFNSQGRGDMITLLLHRGADRTARNNKGKTPLDLANTIANYDNKKYFAT